MCIRDRRREVGRDAACGSIELKTPAFSAFWKSSRIILGNAASSQQPHFSAWTSADKSARTSKQPPQISSAIAGYAALLTVRAVSKRQEVKNMKKFIAMITSICLCAVAFLSTPALVSAVGNDEPAFIVEEVSGHAGDEVTVNINVNNNPGICAAGVTVSYDGNTLELKSVTNGSVLGGNIFGPVSNNPIKLKMCIRDSISELHKFTSISIIQKIIVKYRKCPKRIDKNQNGV